MKYFLKWLGIVLAGLVILTIISAIALPFILPLEKIKTFVINQLSTTLQREVRLEKVSFNLFSGFKLEQLYIGNRPGFSQTPFVSADAIELHYAFWPLFSRQLLVKEIRLVRPEILIEKNYSGEFNFSDLTKEAKGPKAKERKPKPKESGKPPLDLIVAEFSIKDGLLAYIDHPAKSSSEIKDLNLKISGFGLAFSQPITFSVSANTVYQGKTIPLAFSGSVGLNLAAGQLDLSKLTLTIAGETLSAVGSVRNFQTTPNINLALSTKRLNLGPLLALFPAPAKTAKSPAKSAPAVLPFSFTFNGKVGLDNVYLQNISIGRASASVNLTGKKHLPIFSALSGRVSFALKAGNLRRVAALAEVGKLLRSNTLQGDIKFGDLSSDLTLKNGLALAKDFKLDHQDYKVLFNGGLDLTHFVWLSGNRLGLKLSPATTRDLPSEFSLLRDKSGWLELTFELTGSLTKPIPKPILDKPIQAAVGKFKATINAKQVELQNQLQEEAKKQLQNLIKF